MKTEPSEKNIELLAPAGSYESLHAALEAGATVVYFGLKKFNARRGAANFAPDKLKSVVKEIHEHGAKAYLTLNIDISQREIGEAVRHVELARQSSVDAVLVKDPAFIALISLYPEMEFHFSTQAAISSSAGMKAAAELGIKRVVLPRELTLEEIRAASSVHGVETEVFVQGALCFSVSGRCLLSSWVGGRSGNRGLCASPCRVVWKTDESSEQARPMSMLDLCLLERIEHLKNAGVRALKIEGRLKKPEWVAKAVGIYYKAMKGINPQELKTIAESLGNYTGRKTTDGFLDGAREHLTGISGRLASVVSETTDLESSTPDDNNSNCLKNIIEISSFKNEKGGTIWNFRFEKQSHEIRVPQKLPKNILRTVSLSELGQKFQSVLSNNGYEICLGLHEPESRISRNAANSLVDELKTFLHRISKKTDYTVRIYLPDNIKKLLEFTERSPLNNRFLGKIPDRIRLETPDAADFCEKVKDANEIILETSSISELKTLLEKFPDRKFIPALPFVIYEEDIPPLEKLLDFCRNNSLAVEINSWDGWWLAKNAGVRIESGPGLAALNALAAKKLKDLGCECVTISIEADREQIETLSSASPAPLSFYVYGRPALMRTRVELPAHYYDPKTIMKDSRRNALQCSRESGMTILRSIEPFSFCGIRNENISVRHLAADLSGSTAPVSEWEKIKSGKASGTKFNYDRKLR